MRLTNDHATRSEAFEWLMMRFGLTYTLATLWMMNHVFYELPRQVRRCLLRRHCGVRKGHLQHLKLVFHKLREHHLFEKDKKVHSLRRRLDSLRHIVEQGHIQMDRERCKPSWPRTYSNGPRKVQAITDWQAHSHQCIQVAILFSISQLLLCFIKRYYGLATPLTIHSSLSIELLRKSQRWE